LHFACSARCFSDLRSYRFAVESSAESEAGEHR
jgi:hypothetical protein